ncbi:hypothetical protein BDZ89DRAFT_1059797 [Hymenopellis radicata]|nr:hypothetical protein BDZ89DRAFT_1059797 [Hymenopellis radicata]
MSLSVDPSLYKKHASVSDLNIASRMLVMLRGMVAAETGEAPCTDQAYCLRLLNDDPMLLWAMRRLWNKKILHKAIGTDLLSDNPPKTHWTARPLLSDAVQVIVRAKSSLENALANKSFPPGRLWEPTMPLPPRTAAHIRDLRIPHVEGTVDHRPVLLLYGLGTFRTIPDLCERLDDIFYAKSNIFLVNGSASGKTKLLYEGLCKHWGLFFTCALDGTNLGTNELVNIARMFPSGLRNASNFGMSTHPNLPAPSQMEYIHAMAHKLASELLLARLALFKAFLEVSYGSGTSVLHKRLWLCFQLQSSLLHADLQDTSGVLTDHIGDASAEKWFLDNAIRQTLQEIFQIWTPSAEESLFIAIDEANCCTEPTPLLQESEEDDVGIPVLKEILRIWHYHTKDFNVTFVVAGVKVVRDSNTGDFVQNTKLQEDYLKQFLPPTLGRSAAGLALARRTQRWLRGRHRLTAAFVTELLEQGFKTPHLYLNQYVSSFIGCLPQDERRFYESGALEDGNAYNTTVLEEDPEPVIVASIHDSLISCLITGKTSIVFDPARILIVNDVIGRFVDTDMQQISIDEPLMLIAAAQWFREKAIALSSWSYYRRPEFKPFRTVVNSTYFMVLAILHAFTRPRCLADLLKFPRVPPWARQKAQLIRLHRHSNKQLTWSYYSYNPGTFAQLVYPSNGLRDIKAWFDNMGRDGAPPFCILNGSASPTVIFPLQLEDNSAVWLALNVLLDPAGDVADTLRQMHPDNILRASLSSSRANSAQKHVQSASEAKYFQRLPSRRTDIGQFSLIRVLAPLYDEIEIAAHIDVSKQNPCAVLDMTKLDEVTSQLSPDNFLKDVIANASGVSQPTIDVRNLDWA